MLYVQNVNRRLFITII